ncbi:MAG TPA: cobalamin-dependent protein [Anaeromyxobacteraceae bacterium]|nr:cobalamin-dependent protein [Anaeromyxobacteraceae bacterium]
MKVTLISPEFPFSGRVPMVPPILEYLGALTLREAPSTALQLLDANQRSVTPADVDGELVGISVWTATSTWAYRFADACRAAGKHVVLGGIHASALPDEAGRHADAVVVGEAESCWGEVLRDAAAGRLRARYDGVQLPLENLPLPLDAKLKGNYQFRAFFTQRGCPYSCTFCSVHQFFGKTMRYRPIPEVVAEIQARAGRVWFNGDDNIWGADPDRAVALFDALAANVKRPWYGFGDLRSLQGAQGERLLSAARRSGLFSVWVGWESDSPQALADYRAAGKQGTDRIETIRRMQGHGLEVVLFSVLGGRGDDAGAFQRTLELGDRLKVGIHPVLLTPLPGTPLFEQYRPHLIPGLGWDAFTGVRAVFEHPDPALPPVERERAYHDLCRELYRPRRIARRLSAIPMKSFPGVHLLSLVAQLPMKRALRLAREEWYAKHAPRAGGSAV